MEDYHFWFSNHKQNFYDKLEIALSKLSRFDVIDRRKIDLILKEQKFQLSPIADPKYGKNIGQLCGVDAFIWVRELDSYNDIYLKLLIKVVDRSILSFILKEQAF